MRLFYRHTATEDLLAREPEDLLGDLAERDLARRGRSARSTSP